MSSWLYPAISTIALAGFLYKLPVLRSDRSATQLGLIGNSFFIFLIFFICTPSIWERANGLTGIVNFPGLLMHVCAVLTTACQQIVILHLAYPREVAWRRLRPRLGTIFVALVLMTILFLMTNSHEESPDDFSLTTQHYAPYLTVYLVVYTLNQLDVTVMCWRYTKVASAPWLRRGLYVTTWTIPFAMVYAVGRTADIIANQVGTTGQAWEPIVGVSICIATLMKTIGWTLPDWGPYLSQASEAVSTLRALKDLKFLHQSLTSQIPDPVLPLGTSEKLSTRLYRKTIEIRDAQWALRIWMDPVVVAIAERECDSASITGQDRAAVIEAAQLRSALEAKRYDIPPPTCTTNPRAADPNDFPTELSFLRDLAHSFKHSPIVREVLRQSRQPTVIKGAQ
ncbi:MAB_1171c family putative transporter [Streptomyces rhizosphaericus]|uniref:MAB_1171c family putative transporter n=1 Tax=Streptomyces rhizosphaericus TaxID=114699 RepID=UPI00117E70B5|nr:MAB_1171c family putative transporter [Streptomyces rhizosphaericus]